LIILTIQAVEGTGMIKDSQIVVAVLRTSGYSILGIATSGAAGTDKTSDAVAGQGIIIVRKIALVGATADDLAAFYSAEAAEAHTALGDFTLVQAEMAGNAGLSSGRILRQTVGLSGTRVNLFYLGPNFLKVGPDAICTEAYYV
jgi:hypothetical protein